MIFLEAVIQGILLGGLYAAIALGLSLIFGIMNILNLAHGAFIVLGAYTAYVLQVTFGLNALASLPVAAVVGFVLGWLIYRWGGLVRLAQGPAFMAVVFTFGLDLVIVNTLANRFETTLRTINTPEFMQQTWQVFGAYITASRLYVAMAAVLLTLLLNWWIQSTRTGRAIRAVRQDREIAALNGVDVVSTYALTFGVGTSVAAISGVFVAFTAPISPETGVSYLVGAFAVAIIGGLGNIRSVIFAGVLYGVTINVSSVAFGAGVGAAIAFALLLVVLLVKPQGLFGSAYY